MWSVGSPWPLLTCTHCSLNTLAPTADIDGHPLQTCTHTLVKLSSLPHPPHCLFAGSHWLPLTPTDSAHLKKKRHKGEQWEGPT